MSRESEHDQLVISIDEMLDDFSTMMTRPFIRRVGNHLRMRNEKAYDPVIIAIGPFHRDKDYLMNMEAQKMRYLKLLLQSREESSVDRYVNAMRNLEQRARKCYAESIPLDKDEFVKMLLLDGIFIIEFLRNWPASYDVREDDPSFQFEYNLSLVCRDLLMFENQIPWFVVEELFGLLEIDRAEIGDHIRPFIFGGEQPKEISLRPEHFLGLVHYDSCYSMAQTLSPLDDNPNGEITINSAKELKETGIIFKKHEEEKISLFDIKFMNNTIYIPRFTISDSTEARFINMLAYEYFFPNSKQKYITDYIYFLGNLLHSPEDAELLLLSGIITNPVGGDEFVYDLFSRLATDVSLSERFSYSDVYHAINIQCKREGKKRRLRWMAILRRDYFDSPWSFISLVAAIVLLSTAVVQMVYAILSYKKVT